MATDDAGDQCQLCYSTLKAEGGTLRKLHVSHFIIRIMVNVSHVLCCVSWNKSCKRLGFCLLNVGISLIVHNQNTVLSLINAPPLINAPLTYFQIKLGKMGSSQFVLNQIGLIPLSPDPFCPFSTGPCFIGPSEFCPRVSSSCFISDSCYFILDPFGPHPFRP